MHSTLCAYASVHTQDTSHTADNGLYPQVPADCVQQLHRWTEGEVHRQGPDVPWKSPSRPPRGDNRWPPGGGAGTQCHLHHPHGGGRGRATWDPGSELTSRPFPISGQGRKERTCVPTVLRANPWGEAKTLGEKMKEKGPSSLHLTIETSAKVGHMGLP